VRSYPQGRTKITGRLSAHDISLKIARSFITDQFSGPGGATGPVCVCVFVSGQYHLNEMTDDLDIWHGGAINTI